MALSNPLGIFRDFRVQGGMVSRQARINVTFRPGALCFARRGSEHMEIPLSASPRSDLLVLGCFVGLATYTSGSVDAGGTDAGGASNSDGSPAMVQARPGIVGCGNGTGFQTAASGVNQILAKHIDLPCFAYDDNTLYLTDNFGTLSFAGFIDGVNQDGTVALRCGEDQRVLFELYSAGQAVSGATSDDTARFVATSFPAGTFSGGVLTLTATGAFSTAQDGVTPAVGDKFIFPLGTITTLVVSAVNSGPYEVTSLGGTGVSATFTRTARFAHGAVITPGTTVKVSNEGTIWKGTDWVAKPVTSAKVVGNGTDDPLMFPAKVIVAKTLASGTATISTVPLRAATQFAVLVDWTGGTPAATTTSIQASTQTPGGIGTASIVLQEQSVLGTLVNTGSATCSVLISQ